MDRPDRLGWRRRTAARLSPCLIALALLAFLLPFASVSCATPRGYASAGGGVTATYRGITLVVGGEPELTAPQNVPAPGGPTAEDHVPPQLFATVAFGLALAALVTAWTAIGQPERPPYWPAALAAAGAVFLALAQLDFDRTRTARIVERLQQVAPAALGRADPAAFVRPGIGFWATLLLLTLAAALNAGLVIAARRARARLTRPVETRAPVATPESLPTAA